MSQQIGKIGMGVIGCGSIAEIAHLPSIDRTPGVELIATCDTDEARAREAAEKWGAHAWHTDYEKMLDEQHNNLDAVIIASPPNVHCEQGVAVAEAKLHLIVEKPLAVTNREAWDIVEACKKAGVKLMVGCDRRFWLQNQWAKQLVEDDVIGKVMMGRATMHEHVRFYQDNFAKTDFRLKPEIVGGSAVSDTGAHAIDLLIWLLGSRVKRVVGVAKRNVLPESYSKADDTAVIMMEHENGAFGYVSCNRFTPAVSQFTELYGDEGTIMTTSDATNPYQTAPLAVFTNRDYEHNKIPEIIRKYRWPQIFWAEDLMTHPVQKRWVSIYPPREPNNYDRLCQHFLDCLINDKKPLVSGEDGAHAIEVMCGVFKSMETGGWVELPLKEEVIPPLYKPRRKR